jgi:hypothetical protein
VFFGLDILVFAYLVLSSKFLPRTIGVLLAIDGLAYLCYSFTHILAPDAAAQLVPWIQLPALIGEGSLCLWLLVGGRHQSRPMEPAGKPGNPAAVHSPGGAAMSRARPRQVDATRKTALVADTFYLITFVVLRRQNQARGVEIVDGATVSVAVVGGRTEAELIAGMLRSHGVSATVSADDAGGQYPQMQRPGVRVLVALSDEASARRLLAAADDAGGSGH